MADDRLLMLMPYRQFFAKAAAEGFRIHSIWDPRYQPAAYLDEIAELSEEMILADFRDERALRALVRETARRHEVAHVLHLGKEDSQLPVCEEARSLGLAPNPPGALAGINDKAAMRRLLRDHGLSPVRSIEVAAPEQAREAVRELGPPVVVKPTCLDGSRAVRLVRDVRDLDGWVTDLAAYGYSGPVLVEEYLRGDEFSVETFTVQGRHHVVGVTAKRLAPPPGFVEMGHVHPAPLPEPERAAIAEPVVALLDAAGYRFGPAHTEVILTAAGPRIVESQTRIGGDRIPLLVEIATGFDIEAAVFRALAGKPVRPGAATRTACVSFFDFGPGRVESVAGLEEAGRLAFVHELRLGFGPGDVLPPVVDSGSRHGHVVVEAASEKQANERTAVVRALLRVVVRPDDRPSSSAVSPSAGSSPPTDGK
ncbi:ATP-grasp domain-containing protein [Streptosporangium sp. CA-135522]|uniref:ATP-grasp domain-containing protein n=1 Tax=Streptosporangium sp. CA-135522 TaxID=3240072 RepID=UPI003D89CF42